jgi:hypothetical protein
VNREHVGARRSLGPERGGFLLRLDELAKPERRLDDADTGLHREALGIGTDGLAKRLERLAVTCFFEQQRAELELQVRVVDVAPMNPGDKRRDYDCRYERQARTE